MVRAETILPPGQSGFVPTSGHESAPDRPAGAVPVVRVQARGVRPAGRDRDAVRRRDHHPRRVRRPERPRGERPRPVEGRRLRDGAGPPRAARAVPPGHPGPARRAARARPPGERHRRPPRLLHAARAAAHAQPPATQPAGPLRRLRRRDQRVDRKVAADPSKQPLEFAALQLKMSPWRPVDSASVGVQLARTIPSGDGNELANWQALRQLGAKRFKSFLPLRRKGQVATIPAPRAASRRRPAGPARTSASASSARRSS